MTKNNTPWRGKLIHEGDGRRKHNSGNIKGADQSKIIDTNILDTPKQLTVLFQAENWPAKQYN